MTLIGELQRDTPLLVKASLLEMGCGGSKPADSGGGDGGGGGGGGGSIEFLGLWKDTGDRAMPIKMNVNPGDPNQVRIAFYKLVSEMKATGKKSGILAAQSYNQMHWSANPHESGYKKHGLIGHSPEQVSRSTWSGREHRHEGMRFEGFEGVVDILGGDWQNAVYRVNLDGGGGGGGGLQIVRAWYGGPHNHHGQVHHNDSLHHAWLWQVGDRKGKNVTSIIRSHVRNGELNFNPERKPCNPIFKFGHSWACCKILVVQYKYGNGPTQTWFSHSQGGEPYHCYLPAAAAGGGSGGVIRYANLERPVSYDDSVAYAKKKGGRLATLAEMQTYFKSHPPFVNGSPHPGDGRVDQWAAVTVPDHDGKDWVQVGIRAGNETGKSHRQAGWGYPGWGQGGGEPWHSFVVWVENGGEIEVEIEDEAFSGDGWFRIIPQHRPEGHAICWTNQDQDAGKLRVSAHDARVHHGGKTNEATKIQIGPDDTDASLWRKVDVQVRRTGCDR